MSDLDGYKDAPWRDPEHYKVGRSVRCLGCRKACHETHWGKWCYECNVERIERINGRFKTFAEAIGEPLP